MRSVCNLSSQGLGTRGLPGAGVGETLSQSPSGALAPAPAPTHFKKKSRMEKKTVYF